MPHEAGSDVQVMDYLTSNGPAVHVAVTCQFVQKGPRIRQNRFLRPPRSMGVRYMSLQRSCMRREASSLAPSFAPARYIADL